MSARGYDDVAVFGFPMKTAGPAIGVDQPFTNNIGRFRNVVTKAPFVTPRDVP